MRKYGTDYKKMTVDLLEEAEFSKLLPADKTKCIGIKPNLMSCIPAEFGATTHPEICEAIVEYLQKTEYNNIVIIEGSWVGDKTREAFEICGYNKIAEKYGVKIHDTQNDGYFEVPCEGIDVKVCDSVKVIDFLINVPVVKGHCQTNVTCALKNMKGLIPNVEKRRFHAMGLHKPIAVLNKCIKQDFIVVDHICGDLDCESGGNPYYSNCIMAATDPVLVDAFVCKLLGYGLEDVPYIVFAEKLGVGTTDLSGVGEISETLPVTHRIFKLRDRVQDVDTCSACYESLMRALSELNSEGILDNFNEKILIGQGNRGKCGGYGIGNCTKNFDYNIPGCPPKAEDIYVGIKKWMGEEK